MTLAHLSSINFLFSSYPALYGSAALNSFQFRERAMLSQNNLSFHVFGFSLEVTLPRKPSLSPKYGFDFSPLGLQNTLCLSSRYI